MFNIVLDPGHGGWDPGTTAGGLIEKHYELNIACHVRELLKVFYADIAVVMTRETDKSVHPESAVVGLGAELGARCHIANRLPDSLFVSFHHDAAGTPDSTAEGGTLYVYGPRSWVPAVAADGKPNHEAPRSYLAAARMLPIFREVLKMYGMGCNGIKAGDFQVLRDTKRRGVLIEGFFATNPHDAATAKRTDFQADLADAYARMIGAALELPTVGSWAWPQIKVVLPDGRTIWGEGRGGVGWMPLAGTMPQHWVPIRATAEAMGRTMIWTDVPPTANIV